MRTAIAIGLLLVFPGWGVATIIRVPGDAPTIREGIDAAAAGDTVLVAPGTYVGALNRDLDFGGENMVLASEAGAPATTIDCEESGRAFFLHSGEDSTTVIRGFTVANGRAAGCGGAVFFEGHSGSGATFEDCVFTNCAAQIGGAVYSLEGGTTWFRDSEFVGNTASEGGAIHSSDTPLRVETCMFSGNKALNGGAVNVFVWGDQAFFTACVFESNTATADGGAAILKQTLSRGTPGTPAEQSGHRDRWIMDIRSCEFRDNTAGIRGGALSLWGYGDQFATVQDCVFAGNTAPEGGAIADQNGLRTLTGTVFSRNSAEVGGAIYMNSWGPWQVENCTFVWNAAATGAAISWSAHNGTLARLIIALSSGGSPVACPDGEPTFLHSLVFANSGGDTLCGTLEGILYDDPLFCGALGDDFTLCANSPCLPDPGHNPWGELIGAYGAGCPDCESPVEPVSWGAIKAMYR